MKQRPEQRPDKTRNLILAKLARKDLARLRPHLEPIVVELRHMMEESNRPISHVYFMEQGIASTVAKGADGKEIEVGLIGREGMSGLSVLMGHRRTPNRTYAQVAGHAQRIPVRALRSAFEASATLRTLLLRYAHSFMIQTAHTAIANGRANLEQRLARWVLMAHDRMETDEVPLTHEFLSIMLGVRRAGVTTALNALEGRRVVRPGRGLIEVLDRKGLEKLAGGYYGIPEAEWRRALK